FDEENLTPHDHLAPTPVHHILGHRTPGAVVFNHAATAPVRLSDVYDWLEEYGYVLRRLPLTRWRAGLPRSSEAAQSMLAFFDATDATHRTGVTADDATGPDLRLGRIRAENVVGGLYGSDITSPPVDRDLVFRYLDHCVTTAALPAPAGKRGHHPSRSK
ncbi:non-ribosomal peptide synthetase, partial [Streptomyces broussonetiae]